MAPYTHTVGATKGEMASGRRRRDVEVSERCEDGASNGTSVPGENDDPRGNEGDDANTRREPPAPDPSEIYRLGRMNSLGNDSSKVYQGFEASDLPGVRFSHWMQFKNRFENDDLGGIAVEALIGPPDLRTDMIVDDYRRTLANTGGTLFPSGLANFNHQSGNLADAMVHRVRILSPAVRRRLSSLISSNVDGTTQPLTFVRPFREFIEYQDKMKMELMYAEDSATQTMSFGDEHKDLLNYVNFVEKIILPLRARWDPTRTTLSQKIRFVDLWYLFTPGELVYRQDIKSSFNGQPELPRISMLLSTKLDADNDDFSDKIWNQMYTTWHRTLSFNLLRLDFDGRAFRPVLDHLRLGAYEGERDVRSLSVWPLKFGSDEAQIRSEYEEYGRKFTKYCTNRRHWFHSGWTLDWSTPLRGPQLPIGHPGRQALDQMFSEFVDSEVIVDFQEALRSFAGWKPNFLDPMPETTTPSAASTTDMWPILTWSDQESTSIKSSMSETVVYDSGLEAGDQNKMVSLLPMLAHGTADVEELKDIHFALLPRRVFAYSLRDRKFILAHVDSLSEVKYDNGGFKNLRINQAHLRMIKSLVRNHFNTKRLESIEGVELAGQDFIHGKGRGVVVLLHGVPGVGKTATAEAVAQEYAKPLFPMTCGDLGTTPEVVSRNLLDIFRLANMWECVLLLDEADVFLSRREQRSNDLLRNALVSVFLRVLEYYSGILFLTTNRPGVLDEAVKSRVHASFFYPHLGWDQTRDIFKLNIERLRRMESQRAEFGNEALVIMDNQIMKFAEEHYHQHNENEGRWNGRQIRNAFQIAAGLAHLDGEEDAEAAENSGLASRGSSAERAGVSIGVQRQLGKQHFQEVADAILKYDQFRTKTLGKYDDEVAKDRNERPEELPENQSAGPSGYGYGGSRMRGDHGSSGHYERYGRYDGGGGHRGYPT